MVTICLECGDVGFDNAYVYCVKCLKIAVHRYCLPEIPKTFDEFVRWVCDDCEALTSGPDRYTELVLSASTSGSNEKRISQSSLAEDENYGQTELMLQSAHKNLCSSGDARLADESCLCAVEPNANTDWSQKENVPTEHDHHSDTSRKLDEVEEVKFTSDESLQITNLRKKTEVPSSLSVKENQIFPTTSNQKRFDGESQSDTSRHNREDEDEALADKLSKRTEFRINSDISSPIPEKHKQRQTASNHIPVAYQKTSGSEAPSRFSPLGNERRSSNSPRIHGVEATKLGAKGSSQRTKFAMKRHTSTTLAPKYKQMRWSASPNQFQSQQPKRFGDHSSRYPPFHNELKKHWSRSLINVPEERYSGHSLRKSHEARRPMQNPVRERKKEHVKEESLAIPSRSNVTEEVSLQTHKARRPMNNTIPKKLKERVTDESLVTPTRSDVSEEVSLYPIITPSVDGPRGYSLQVQPVVDPIWRGKFDIVNKKDVKFEGFVAHLSNRACQRVIEEARLLPALLKLEMVPKSTVWPISFQSTKPRDDKIALYIFPADTRQYEKMFNRLVDDMSEQELAMRATTKNAELLVFSSTELEMEYWRFQNKYYIWGVFKGKR